MLRCLFQDRFHKAMGYFFGHSVYEHGAQSALEIFFFFVLWLFSLGFFLPKRADCSTGWVWVGAYFFRSDAFFRVLPWLSTGLFSIEPNKNEKMISFGQGWAKAKKKASKTEKARKINSI